jgi:hypothetical protein
MRASPTCGRLLCQTLRSSFRADPQTKILVTPNVRDRGAKSDTTPAFREGLDTLLGAPYERFGADTG